MQCQDVMKRNVKCVVETDTIKAAARKMRDYNIGFVPVCDGLGRVVGTLTDRDVAVRVAANDNVAADATVAQFMTQEVVACLGSDDLREAERRMALAHKARVLVVDEQGQLRGVISLSDVAEHDSARRVAQTLRKITQRETIGALPTELSGGADLTDVACAAYLTTDDQASLDGGKLTDDRSVSRSQLDLIKKAAQSHTKDEPGS